MTEELSLPASTPETTSVEPQPNLRERAKMLLDRLAETYPGVFFPLSEKRVKPLKLGIHKDLAPVIKEWGFEPMVLRYALSGYTRQLRYQMALLHDPQRVDLQGAGAGEISAEHRQIAQERAEQIREKRRQRQDAQGNGASQRPPRKPRRPSPEPTAEQPPPASPGPEEIQPPEATMVAADPTGPHGLDDPTAPTPSVQPTGQESPSATRPATAGEAYTAPASERRSSWRRPQETVAPPHRRQNGQPQRRPEHKSRPMHPRPPELHRSAPPPPPSTESSPSANPGTTPHRGIDEQTIAALQKKLSTKAII